MNFKTLISDDGKNVSIGRTLLWIFTIVIVYRYAVHGEDIPINIVYIYGLLVFYNLAKKPMPILEKYIEIRGVQK